MKELLFLLNHIIMILFLTLWFIFIPPLVSVIQFLQNHQGRFGVSVLRNVEDTINMDMCL